MKKRIQIRVKERGNGFSQEFLAERGENLREVLLRVGRSPYRGMFHQFNCRGLGICGSCTVWCMEGGKYFPRRACQIRCFQDLEIELG